MFTMLTSSLTLDVIHSDLQEFAGALQNEQGCVATAQTNQSDDKDKEDDNKEDKKSEREDDGTA